MNDTELEQERRAYLDERARERRDGVLGAAWLVACALTGLAGSIRVAALLALGASLVTVAARWAHERFVIRSARPRPGGGVETVDLTTSREGEELAAGELARFRSGACPDCLGRSLVEGPHGGFAVNVYCVDPRCGSRFNDVVVVVQRISERGPLALRPMGDS